VEMSEAVQQTQKKYPVNEEDIETEKEIVEAIQKLTPAPLKLKAFAINHNLLKLKELENVEQEEITQKDLEGQKAFQPNITIINDLVNATRQPKDEELTNLDQYFTPEELAKKDELFAQIKPISEYWLTAMKNHPVLKSALNENDAKALKHLTRVEYKLSEDAQHPLNFSIHFHFTPNEYFENEVLTATLHIKEPRECSKIVGTEIKWKEGKNLTKKTVQKKQRNKKTGQTRTVTKEEECDSIFKLFKDCEECDHDHDHDHGDDDEDEHDEHDEIFDHTEWAYSLFEELIPYSLEYFLGVRKDYLGPDGEDDEDFEDDEDDEDEDEAPKGKKGAKPQAKTGGKPAAGDEQKKECKQQ